MFNKKFLLLASTLLISSNLAFAGQNTGFYAGAQVGGSHIDGPKVANQSNQAALQDSKQYSYSYGFNVGYKTQVSDKILVGAELAYNNDGKATITYASGNKYKIGSQDLDLLATAQYNLDNGYSLLGKFGVAMVEQRYQIWKANRASGYDPTNSATDYRPVLVLGVSHPLNDKTDLYLGYKRIFANDLGTTNRAFSATSNQVGANGDVYKKVANVDTLFLGVSYNF